MNETTTIGNVVIPSIGLGTYLLTGIEGERSISRAISLGYRHIDTAKYYENEYIVGNATKNSGLPRNEFFITTKIWPADFSEHKFIPAVENSLKELQTDYIDLLLLHWPGNEKETDLAMNMLSTCQQKGYTKLIGVSNFSVAQLESAREKANICCNQVEYHPYKNQRELLNYMQSNDILLTAYTPLAHGKIYSNPQLKSLAEKYNKTISQLVLRWFIQQKNVSPIPKASSDAHLIENMQIFDFQVSAEDMKIISGIAN
jgi:2,5-diketo-D-gluconate reductase B